MKNLNQISPENMTQVIPNVCSFSREKEIYLNGTFVSPHLVKDNLRDQFNSFYQSNQLGKLELQIGELTISFWQILSGEIIFSSYRINNGNYSLTREERNFLGKLYRKPL